MIHRRATLAELGQVLDWAAEEGWNPGLDDAAAFYAADPDGFFVTEIGGQPVAAISVVNHSDEYAFLGLYICRPEHRSTGVGFALWQFALEHAGKRTVGLDGVPAQEANYARSGFVLAGRTQRLCGHMVPEEPTFPLATPDDFTALAQLDAAANGVSRPRFLRAWLESGATRKTVVLRDGDTMTGFATARTCRTGCKIGPIVAADADDAHRLARQAAAALADPHVTIDTPDPAGPFADLLRQDGFTQNFSTARMFRGNAPTPGKTLQAVASLELG
ncbi:GNAT family N-acetyltransferase [Primorskyibacter aestuariivivens]|uniref:GNAT family N-acetyltransferase n=1 Tax=Primorskyibacter aestuariivivens TaxID=1888912 RepID=UPI002300E572|nr:GNAT family N-acetyltransferase [Primorskyibacter aestuariivivens]MDA7428940.1 GNAT family N-acetyltransferase [Primorskyibacter aestuariivivens]